ncbi:MAG: glycogen debranching enzyme N-terminal domain-containing protein [Verrucomicrobia bacterium]|nr:glycogen debranching enzyme N-terminal domain-containing protein [Verrucomicrobiota bacterium]
MLSVVFRFAPIMTPATGERLLRFVGDRVRFTLRDASGAPPPEGWSARLRTNLGRADLLRSEILKAHTHGVPVAGASWRDLPMKRERDGWSIELPLAEVGFFSAKAYALDPRGWLHWPDGPDVGISVHPDRYRSANTIYCAFVRMFGPTRTALATQDPKLDEQLKALDLQGYTVIPPSGTLRDLAAQLPHIVDTLGCRIVQLLPINPTPTTYARFGRFGSPYASLDLTAVDPALVEFDKRATGVDQFRELTYAAHARGARVFLDIVINHTGWGSPLQENHPEWYLRKSDGEFASPGAWGVTWEDLVELKHDNVALWDELSEVFLTWCRRGVDGFRCDAGYKVPVPAWQYIVARVRQEFPETVFLLEGLGGTWEATEALLTEGGMQWAYSELFQNYSGREVATYLDYSLRQSGRLGLYVHYSETHDNPSLAEKGRAWSLLRTRLCALASVSGGFGFTGGVEWLAAERINVHSSRGMSWGNPDNIIKELAHLNRLVSDHPCFLDGAKLARLSPDDSTVLALRRDSAEGKDSVLVLANLDTEAHKKLTLEKSALPDLDALKVDLLGLPLPKVIAGSDGKITFTLAPGAAHCLAHSEKPAGLGGEAYRRARAQAAWGLQAIGRVVPVENVDGFDWRWLAQQAEKSPRDFLAAVSALDGHNAADALPALVGKAARNEVYPRVVVWEPSDRRRITPVPPGHWLLVRDSAPFRETLEMRNGAHREHVESIAAAGGHVACFAPRVEVADATLSLERYAAADQQVEAPIRFLSAEPSNPKSKLESATGRGVRAAIQNPKTDALVLLTNGRGGMARMCADLGRVRSKYDCVLAANLHPSLPVDRHVLAKRIRVWVNADGFLTPLDGRSIATFAPGPPAVWDFVANAGDARTVQIQFAADMIVGSNTTVFRFSRPTEEAATGKQLPAGADVRLTVRLDIEDRNFHWETKRNGGAEHHFATNTHTLEGKPGFAFTPAADRKLRVFSDAGTYHPQPEWSDNIPHPVEASRGQEGAGDAYSPGWFEMPLPKGACVTLVATAEESDPTAEEMRNGECGMQNEETGDAFAGHLRNAARAFVVKRDSGKTVIAGYPWFLDWGRDSLICARGLLAAGMTDDVRQLLGTFARFEDRGTLPNTIHGDNIGNRDTSDAPLWFGVACEELAAIAGGEFYRTTTRDGRRPIADVLRDIAAGYLHGTPNGIRVDRESGLVWSPSHFTWMDTNHPACTPREGYPVEIQALWVRLLRQLDRIGARPESESWAMLANRAMASVEKLFWIEERGWFADVLIAPGGGSAACARVDDALRSNQLFLVSLGLVGGDRARRCVEAAARHLVVPGALRSLAPLPVTVPLPIHARDGRLLNDPHNPYQGRYEGDEDTRRKPAYHNGTAWTWTFPVFCEALACAWEFSPEAVAAARSYLGSVDRLMAEGCIGQLPEIVDGDAPHTPRGCDAQAWGVTETLRVWKLLK